MLSFILQGCTDLYKVAHHYVMENFTEIIKESTTEFLQLSEDELYKLLASGDLIPNFMSP